MRSFWRLCISLELCLGLLAVICATMAAGSFRLSGEYAAAINAMPLFSWLRQAPFTVSWWLWLSMALLFLLAVNTVLCSVTTINRLLKNPLKRAGAGFLLLLAPQMMHAGFLLIMAAHLLGATDSFMEQIVAAEGAVIRLPDGRSFAVNSIGINMSPMGMATAISSELEARGNDAVFKRVAISPNHPWLSGGYGVYIKQAEAYPYPRALLEIHREPGAAPALAGALLFMAGNILLLYLRNGAKESPSAEVDT